MALSGEVVGSVRRVGYAVESLAMGRPGPIRRSGGAARVPGRFLGPEGPTAALPTDLDLLLAGPAASRKGLS